VQHLDDGEAIVVSDWLEKSPMRIQWRRKRTIDFGATPGLGGTRDVELKGVSSDIVGELEDITRQKQQEKKEVERLRSRVDELEDKLAEKEDELERAQDMRDMAKQLADSLSASAGDEGGEPVSQRIEELQAEAQKERRKRQGLEEQIQEYESRIGELEEEAQVSDRLRRIDQHREDIEEAVRRLAEVFGLGSDADERLRERLREYQKQVRKLKESKPRAPEINDLASFLEHEDVQRAISRAKEEGSKLQVRRVLESLVDDEGGPTTVGDVLKRAGLSTSSGGNVQNVREAAQALKEVGIVSVRGSDLATKIEMIQDLSRVQERVGVAETRERLKDVV
jgi:chromosome segregation ATPase